MPKYKMFRIGALFVKLKTKYFGCGARYSDISNVKTGEYCVPVTSAKRGDNGICRWAKQGQFQTHKNVISVVYNGAIAAGLVYYQPFNVSSLTDSYLIGLRNSRLDECSGLYLACAIQKVTKAKYSREKKAVWSRVKEEFIELPVTDSGNPDYEYMASYIANIRGEYLAKLDACTAELGLDNVIISDADIATLSRVVNTTPFRVGSLFDVINNPQLDKKFFLFDKAAKYPYFTRTENNNGVLGYVEYLDETHKIRGNSLAVGMISMKFHYMPHDFYAGQFTKTLIPKFNEFDELIAMYFITELNARSEYYQGYLVREFASRVKDTLLNLPATDKGEPDYEYMRSYIRVQQKQVLGKAMAGIYA